MLDNNFAAKETLLEVTLVPADVAGAVGVHHAMQRVGGAEIACRGHDAVHSPLC